MQIMGKTDFHWSFNINGFNASRVNINGNRYAWSITWIGNEPLPGNGTSCNFHANFAFAQSQPLKVEMKMKMKMKMKIHGTIQSIEIQLNMLLVYILYVALK